MTGAIRILKIAVTVGLGSSFLASCVLFPGDPGPPIGFKRIDNRVEILLQLCPGQEVTRVTVSELHNFDVGIAIWRISSPGLPTDRFTIGRTPSGWRLETALKGARLPSTFDVAIRFSDGRTDLFYESAYDAPAGLVQYEGRSRTEADFFGKLRSSRCRN